MAYIHNNDDYKLITGTSEANEIRNCGKNVTVDTGEGNDTIYNYQFQNSEYLSGENAVIDSISNEGSNSIIEAGNGNDTINNSGTAALIRAGADNDFITNGATNVSIYAGTGNDIIRNYSSSVVITGGAGNDSISLASYSHYNLIDYTNGDGKDVILGFDEDDTLSISSSSYFTTSNGRQRRNLSDRRGEFVSN